MAKVFDRPITIQKSNELTEDWDDVYKVHASINKAKANSEYLTAGAIQGKINLVFEVRYFKEIESISSDTQSYRVVYNDTPFNITDYDDFKLLHKTVKLLGVSY
jgi:SPP1 family predicted phage head-tail adaptor